MSLSLPKAYAAAMPPTTEPRATAARMGLAAAIGAYLFWGFAPFYFKALTHVPPLEILAHRVVWSVVFLLPLVAWRGQWRVLAGALRPGPVLWSLLASSALIAVNWLTFIWAVVNARLLDASLGYFINPLVNVLLGVAVLGERLRRAQVLAVAVAAAGVAVQTAALGRIPWVAVILAVSFSLYALMRKTARLESLIGLAAETTLLLPLGLAYAAWLAAAGRGALGGDSLETDALLALAGVVTAVPLILFAYGARRLSLTTMGLLQYISPSLQFLAAWLAFGEELDGARLAGFGLIWAALAVYTWDGIGAARRRAAGRE